MGTIAEIMRVPEETALDIDLNNMQHEMWMPYVRELHLKWSGVSLPSIKFCESVFKNHSGISEQSVRDISHYLEHAEGECVQKLRGGNPDGRIGKLGHKIALDLRDLSYLILSYLLLSSLISHLSSLISHLSSLISHLSSLISHLSSLISHLSSLISHLSSLISHLSSHLFSSLFLSYHINCVEKLTGVVL